MIIDKEGMKKMESDSHMTSLKLMEKVGAEIAERIKEEYPSTQKILILAGKGNNGGDAFVISRLLKDHPQKIFLVDGPAKTKEAKRNFKLLTSSVIKTSSLKKAIEWADLIIDGIYGFSYHGELDPDIRKICRTVNDSNKTVISIDINSGSEADTGYCDKDAIHSDMTYVLECWKPVHLLKKEHHLFDKAELIPLGLTHPVDTRYLEMNEDIFFKHFPKKPDDAYKGTYGKTLLIGGSYGMAGAVSLNIIGAETVGASYINVAVPHEIYNIAASKHLTPVFHPFNFAQIEEVLGPLIKDAKAIAFGSGTTKMDHTLDCMDYVLQHSTVPVVLDAEALRLLHRNTWIFRYIKCPIILTPHIGEFAGLINQPVSAIKQHKVDYAIEFAKKNKVYLVLKGPNTIAVSPSGECFINQSGNQALAQAGSGDLLTGMIAGILTNTSDVYQAVCMSVWLHGYIADLGLKDHSIQNFPLQEFPHIMDQLFKKHQY